MTRTRGDNLYPLMGAAYDGAIIRESKETLGKVAVIDSNPRRGEKADFDPPTLKWAQGRGNVFFGVRYPSFT